MPDVLSAAQAARYERQGIVFPIPVLAAAEVARFRAAFEELAALLGAPPRPIPVPHLFFRWAYELATHPAVTAAAAALLGPDVLVHGTLILCKHPGDPAFVAWHQDGNYSGLYGTPNTSAWIALSDSTPESGCMRVIPRSHLQPPLPHDERHTPHNLLGHGEEIRVAVDEGRARDVTLRAGEMSLHHNNIVHGSRVNRGGDKRIGFIVRFVTPRLPASDLPLTRVRGSAPCPHLELLASPPAAAAAEAVAPWRDFLRRRGERQAAGRPA